MRIQVSDSIYSIFNVLFVTLQEFNGYLDNSFADLFHLLLALQRCVHLRVIRFCKQQDLTLPAHRFMKNLET